MYTSKKHLNVGKTDVTSWRKPFSCKALLGLGLSTFTIAALPLAAELRIRNAKHPLTDEWAQIPIAPRGSTLLGITFRHSPRSSI